MICSKEKILVHALYNSKLYVWAQMCLKEKSKICSGILVLIMFTVKNVFLCEVN